VDMSRVGITDDDFEKQYRNACVVYISGPIIFANTRDIENIMSQVDCDCNKIFLSMRGASHMDFSGAQVLLEVIKNLRAEGIEVVICGLSKSMMESMRRVGIAALLGEENFYASVDRALLGNTVARNQHAVCESLII